MSSAAGIPIKMLNLLKVGVEAMRPSAYEVGDVVWLGRNNKPDVMCVVVQVVPNGDRRGPKYILEDIITGERFKNPQKRQNMSIPDPRDIVKYKQFHESQGSL